MRNPYFDSIGPGVALLKDSESCFIWFWSIRHQISLVRSQKIEKSQFTDTLKMFTFTFPPSGVSLLFLSLCLYSLGSLPPTVFIYLIKKIKKLRNKKTFPSSGVSLLSSLSLSVLSPTTRAFLIRSHLGRCHIPTPTPQYIFFLSCHTQYNIGNILHKFILFYPKTIPCCPARVFTLRRILATAVTPPGSHSWWITLFSACFTGFSSFRDAGGKTRRQSMLLWAASITDVCVTWDHFWSLITLWSLIKDWLTFVPRSPWVCCLSGQI